MNSFTRQLKRELRQAGAGASEIDDLAYIASRLTSLKPTPRAEQRRWISILKPTMLASSCLVLGALIVMYSQSATATSWLYPVQRLSDAVAVKADPEYRGTVMMRGAQQVNELVASRASTRVILSTLASYKTEAAAYSAMPHADYAVFDYCKDNLEQAAATAPAPVHQAITNSLRYLDAT